MKSKETACEKCFLSNCTTTNKQRSNKETKETTKETQNKETGGALLVYIDMRFDLKTKKRVYELSEISDIVELYAESLIELLCLPNNIQIPVYVFEKKNIVTIPNKYVKDGLHLIIGLNFWRIVIA